MNRLRDIMLIALVSMQLLWAGLLGRRTYSGEMVQVNPEIGKPYAVLTIDYGEPPKNFMEGEFYVLKVLKIRGTKIDYGFCPIRREKVYNADVP